MKTPIFAAVLTLAACLATAQAGPAAPSPTPPASAAAIAPQAQLLAAGPAPLVCTLQLQDAQLDKVAVLKQSVRIGYTLSICPPPGKRFSQIVSAARMFGWAFEPVGEQRTVFYVSAGKGAQDSNAQITLDDGTAYELELKASSK